MNDHTDPYPDGAARDAAARPLHAEPRDGHPRDGHPRDGHARDGHAREGRPRDGHDYPDDDAVFAKRVPAGKRTYFFDVKATRSGQDFFLTITESKRTGEHQYEKHKLYLYKEDFGKFIEALHEAVDHIRDERLPGHDFSDVPRLAD